MHRSVALLFLFLFLPLGLSGQNADQEWYQNKPIADITFIGLRNVDEGDLTGITSEYIGAEFTDSRLLQLQQRLYGLDLFTQIIPNAKRADSEGSEVVLEFTVEERPIISEILFEGNRQMRRSKIMDVVSANSGDVVSRSRVRMDERAIRTFYRENGYNHVELTSRVEDSEAEGEQRVIFSISEGNQTTIRQIQFAGNSFASDGALRGAMETKQQSLFNSGVYQEAKLEQDRQRIVDYYNERGFIDAEIEDVVTEVIDEEENRNHLIITIYLDEGERYTYEGMSFEGNQVFSDEELSEQVRQRDGSVVDRSTVQQDYQRVSDMYYSSGYIFNQIELQEDRDPNTRTVSYTVNITEFNRAHIEDIIIRGNTKTKDEVIYRELPLEVGDIFSAGKIRDGLFNLMNTGYFTSVVPETPQGSTDGLMDLVINVEEGQTADIRLGLDIGGSSDFPVSGRVAWQDSNFRGLGQTVGAELVASPIEQSLSLRFQEPWLLGQRWSAGTNITLSREVERGVLQYDPFSDAPYGGVEDGDHSDIPNEYRMELQNWDAVLGGNTGYRFITTAGTLSLSTNLSTGLNMLTYDDKQYYGPDEAARRNKNGIPEIVNRWRVGMNLDDRDFVISPSSGYYLSQSVGLTGGFLFGDRHFVQTETTAEGYLTLFDLPATENWNWKLVAKLRSGLSTILPQFWVPGEYNSIVASDRDRLAINGVTNARGWRPDASMRGLHGLWENTFELRMPVNEQILWFDGFFDATYPYKELSEMPNITPQDGLYGIGAGIRFSIPQLPISLYLARLFEINEQGSIEWQKGEIFNRDNEDGKGLRFVLSFSTSFF